MPPPPAPEPAPLPEPVPETPPPPQPAGAGTSARTRCRRPGGSAPGRDLARHARANRTRSSARRRSTSTSSSGNCRNSSASATSSSSWRRSRPNARRPSARPTSPPKSDRRLEGATGFGFGRQRQSAAGQPERRQRLALALRRGADPGDPQQLEPAGQRASTVKCVIDITQLPGGRQINVQVSPSCPLRRARQALGRGRGVQGAALCRTRDSNRCSVANWSSASAPRTTEGAQLAFRSSFSIP